MISLIIYNQKPSQWVGHAGQCPSKTVLSKVVSETHDINTLIRFERGNLVEKIVEKALIQSGIEFLTQLKVKHPEKPFTAHLDFTFVGDKGIVVLKTNKQNHEKGISLSSSTTLILNYVYCPLNYP